MQNIPVFTARHGMASLVLREIPYSKTAYILVRAVWNGQAEGLLQECAAFCRGAGAETVYASHGLEPLPAEHAYDILRLSLQKERLPKAETEVELEAVSPRNGNAYLDIYNRCFRDMPGAAYYDNRDLKRMLQQNNGFLARKDGQYAGVVELDPDGLAGIAVLPEYRGLGYSLALTALAQVNSEMLYLKVAGTNIRALALYRRIGFENDTRVSSWWRV